MKNWFAKARAKQPVRRQQTFRPRVESLEDRVTPSVNVLSTTHAVPVMDTVAATSTTRMHYLDPSSQTAVPIASSAVTIGWGSGIPGATLKGQVLDTSTSPAQLVEVGYAPDPSSSDIDLLIANISTLDGTGTFTLYNTPGMNVKGLSVDVDASGVTYVAGTIGSGSATSGLVERFQPGLPTSPDWMVIPAGSINLKGVKLDTAGTNLYVVGAAPGTHTTDTLVIKYNGLGGSTPNAVWTTVRSSGAGPSYGNAITVNSDGRTNVAGSTRFDSLGDATFSPGVLQFQADGSTLPGWGFRNLSATTDNDMNSVALDTADGQKWIAVGNFAGDIITLKMVRTMADGGDPNDILWSWDISYADSSGNPAAATANSVAIDAAGNYYVGGSLNSNGPTGIDMLAVKINGSDSDGATQIDGIAIDIGPNNTDVVFAITLDSAGNAYIAGTSNSDGAILQLTGWM
jgi:hypothetical protein